MKPRVLPKGFSLGRFLMTARQNILRHPRGAVALSLLSGFSLWLVATKSLPLALAKTNPELASQLAPEHPDLLLARAKRTRRRLVQIVAAELAKEKKASAEVDPDAEVGRFAVADLAEPQATAEVDREALRARIRKLATQVLESNPLSARAFRLLAEASEEQGAVRGAMEAAFQRSRRETTAAFWLLNDSFQKRDAAAVLLYADVILRTKGQLAPLVISYLGQLTADDSSRGKLVETLSTNPSWRGTFFRNLPKSVSDPRVPLKVLLDLKQTPQPVTDAELKPYLDKLMRDGRVELAYSAWLQHLPAEKLSKLRRITNEGFEDAVSGLPFNWVITNPRYASIEAHARSQYPDNQALHLNLGPGRIKFGEVRQVLVLPPGTYQLSGLLNGALRGRRGVRWQLRCGERLRNVLGQSQLLLGDGPKWAPFTMDFVVPDDPSCGSQTLRLFHHARSASEELIFGELWFDDLRIRETGDLAGG